jgi:putative protease
METNIGQVTHYFGRISVAVLKLTGELKVGDWILFLGHTTDFSQQVQSMEIEHKSVESVRPGDDVALKVIDRVRAGDEVFLKEEEETD